MRHYSHTAWTQQNSESDIPHRTQYGDSIQSDLSNQHILQRPLGFKGRFYLTYSIGTQL